MKNDLNAFVPIATGKFVVDRKDYSSELWLKPAWYYKLWCLILGSAAWSDTHNYSRGKVLFITLNDISKALVPNPTKNNKRPSSKQIMRALTFLQEMSKISLQNVSGKIYLEVLNYNHSQMFEQEEFSKHCPGNVRTILDKTVQKLGFTITP